jgi:hypothetical protein
MQIAKRNRRSRRLQKKNSLDVQFRRRFSMLRDNNAAVNNIYNESESAFNAMDTDGGRESRNSSMMPNLGPRASSGNLSTKILDKRFNKMLFNMHGIPVKPNVINQNPKKGNQKNSMDQSQQDYQNDPIQHESNELGNSNQNNKKGNRKRKNQNIVEQNV